MSDDAGLHVMVDGPVTTIRLDRPDQLNALTPQMHDLMQAALDRFAADESQRIGILTGTGRAFCAGSDLKLLAARRAAGLDPLALPRCGYGGIVERCDLDKPLIAVVNGVAAGGGFEIALACDLIIAVDTARFGLPETRFGQVAIGGGPHRLARQIPLKQAMAIALSGDFIDAGQALAMGLVNEVVPADQLEEATRRWIDRILRCAPLAVQATKQLMMQGLAASCVTEAITSQTNLPAMAQWRGSAEGTEGASAFAARCTPAWVAQ
jgi:enoyl-CoA hydratase/carnithine racemase